MLGKYRDPDSFTSALLLRLAQRARLKVKPFIGSKTLRRSLEVRLETSPLGTRVQRSAVFLPQYWARYYHDGRRSIGLNSPGRKKPFLIYFANPKNDPRIKGGYPVRESDIRPLTPEEFRRGAAKNRAMFRANPSGGPQQYMKVRREVGPAEGDPFFERGLRDFPSEAAPYIREEFAKWFIAGTPRPRVFAAARFVV
jgi:hypothetical protein